jgi:hypothetical protein
LILALLFAALLPAEQADTRSFIAAQHLQSKLERHISTYLPDPKYKEVLRRLVDATWYGDLTLRTRLVKDHLSAARNDYLDAWIATAEDVRRKLKDDAIADDIMGMVLWRLNAVDRTLTYASPYPHPALSTGRYPVFGPHGDYPAMMQDHFSSLDYFRRAAWDDVPKLVSEEDYGALIEYTVWADRTYDAIGLLADVEGQELQRACRVQAAFDLLSLQQQDRYHGYKFTRFSDSWRFNGRSWHHATCFDTCGGCK